MTSPDFLVYFQNPVGRVLEHPDGYAVVEYAPGPRQLDHLQAFLTHVGQLLRRRGWNRILGDQRAMDPSTPEESAWILDFWLTPTPDRMEGLRGAVLLPRDAFASLSVSQMMHEAQAAALTYRMFDEHEQAEAEAWLRQLAAQ